MENKQYIVGLGEALWDVFPDGKQLGGAPANFAYHVTQFGLNGLAISAVGDDQLGHEIREKLGEKNLNCILQTSTYPTGTVQVTLDQNGVPMYEITHNVAWDNIMPTEEFCEVARNARAVCFGSLAQRSECSRNAIRKFLELMPKEDTLKVFDINLRQNYYSKEIIVESLEACNVFKINDDEFEIVCPMLGIEGSITDSCKEIVKRYSLKYLILTCGTNGSYIFTADGDYSFLPTPMVEVADTVGAGDSFTAAFIASIILGHDFRAAHKKAVELSAYVCTCEGAMPEHKKK